MVLMPQFWKSASTYAIPLSMASINFVALQRATAAAWLTQAWARRKRARTSGRLHLIFSS